MLLQYTLPRKIPGLHLRDLLLVWVLPAAALRCERGSLGRACQGGWWRRTSQSDCYLYCCWPCAAHGFDPWSWIDAQWTWRMVQEEYRHINVRSETYSHVLIYSLSINLEIIFLINCFVNKALENIWNAFTICPSWCIQMSCFVRPTIHNPKKFSNSHIWKGGSSKWLAFFLDQNDQRIIMIIKIPGNTFVYQQPGNHFLT